MADVRELLRKERADRQQSGQPPKTSAVPTAAPISKKRKAINDTTDERKRTRTAATHTVPSGHFNGDDADRDSPTLHSGAQPASTNVDVKPAADQSESAPPQISQTSLPQEDDADLEAFMKEIEEAPQPIPERNKYGVAGVVAEAAPMTAAELAAQAREEQSAQRGKREEELEADKEEAAQHLQDELDEMEGLEERLRKLREQREALRKARVEAATADIDVPDPESVGNESEDSESADEEWDDWRFRPA